MVKVVLFVSALFFGSYAFATVDFDNLPEPTKELCSDAKFMTEFSQEMQGLTDQDKLMKASQFIQKCQTAMMN